MGGVKLDAVKPGLLRMSVTASTKAGHYLFDFLLRERPDRLVGKGGRQGGRARVQITDLQLGDDLAVWDAPGGQLGPSSSKPFTADRQDQADRLCRIFPGISAPGRPESHR